MIYLYLLIGYIVSVLLILLTRILITSYAFESKADRREQLYHDVMISIVGLPLLCVWCVIGLCELVKHILGFK